jgi:hypothetical protein
VGRSENGNEAEEIEAEEIEEVVRPRAVGGFEPDDKDQQILVELWHLSLTALSGSGNTSRDNRLQWVIDSFMKEHGKEPNVAHKWIYVWCVDNIGTHIPAGGKRSRRSTRR